MNHISIEPEILASKFLLIIQYYYYFIKLNATIETAKLTCYYATYGTY